MTTTISGTDGITWPDGTGPSDGADVENIQGDEYAFVSRATVASTLSQVFTGLTTAGDYKFILRSITHETDNGSIYLRVSIDGGSTYEAGASDYLEDGSSTAQQIIFNQIGSTAGEGADAEIVLPDVTNATVFQRILAAYGGRTNATPGAYNANPHGVYVAGTDAVNAVQFISPSGDWSGVIEAWVRAAQ